MSTAFHPQTDGQTERLNRTMEEMLRIYATYKQDQWDEYLPAVEFAYNNSKNASTGFTPFELDCGQRPQTPLTMTSCHVIDDVKQRSLAPLTTSSGQRLDAPLTTSSRRTTSDITNVAAANEFIKHWDNIIAMAKDALRRRIDNRNMLINIEDMKNSKLETKYCCQQSIFRPQ